MSLETSFPIPDGYGFRHAHGQGRVVGFLIQRFLEPPRAVVIHLDYPGISMESKVSPPYATEAGSTVRIPLYSRHSHPLKLRCFLVLSVEYLHPDRKSGGCLQH